MKINNLNLTIAILVGLAICLSCKSDNKILDTNAKLPDNVSAQSQLEATKFEIFKVEPDAQTNLKPTTLKYKEVKYHRGDLLVRQDFYEVNNTLKGFEVITKEKDGGISNYYSVDSVLLAIYHLAYIPGTDLVMRKEGFDGQTKDLLRIETYEYDNSTNGMKSKIIFDASGSPVRKYEMSLDDKGNEKTVAIMNPDGTAIANESYEVLASDNTGRWTERWGKVNGEVKTFQRRIFSKLNK